MSTITDINTTFDSPNYHGNLIAITPTDTPLLAISGGLSEGKETKSTTFEWQTEDLRDPDVRPRLEGADAPEAEARARANVENVAQIFHESVATSYTKQAATRQYATSDSAPFHSADGEENPVVNEHTRQIMNALKTIARDVNYSFWHGKMVKPTTNATARQTGGLLEAISTHRKAADEKAGLSSAAANAIAETGTALSNGDKVVFTQPPAELRADRTYFVVSKATDSFKVAATAGGAALTVATGQSGIAYIPAATVLTVDLLDGLMGDVYDSGGISESEAATLFLGSKQKAALTKAYADAYGKTDLFSNTRNVAGRNLQTIETNFGTLNVVLERALPADAIAVVSAEQLAPVFLNIPGKGVLFEEELAKTGSSDKTQIYGEIGLKYGNELAHGIIRGLAV